MTDPAAPTTEAGRRLEGLFIEVMDGARIGVLPARNDDGYYTGVRAAILAIEAEARSTPAEPLDVERLRLDIIEVLHRYECDEEPPGHDWREHLPEDEPDFHPNRIDGLVALFAARLRSPESD